MTRRINPFTDLSTTRKLTLISIVPALQRVAMGLLTKMGHSVTLAENGKIALDAEATGATVFDQSRATALLARVGGDPQLFRDVIELFLDDCPNQLDAIREAIHDQQPDRVYRAAHKLKGSAGNFEAHEVMALLQRLEACSRDGDLATCGAVFMEIEAETERLMSALAEAIASEVACAS
jgi:HPt (histidine-containing phosphotransfer) domain-containing protein